MSESFINPAMCQRFSGGKEPTSASLSLVLSVAATVPLFLFIGKFSSDNGEESSLLELTVGCADRLGVKDSSHMVIV